MKLLKILICLTLSSCSFGSGVSDLEQAEEYSRKKDYDQAISSYRTHIQRRLAVKDRPDWENPYFYLIIIGDIQLGQGKAAEALSSYQEADQMQVDPYLVLDRIRSVARYYEKESRMKEAIDLLEQYRDRDDVLFDSMLDRLSKELTHQEDSWKTSP